MKKTFTLLLLMVSLFATAQQNGAAEYMYIHRSNGVVDSVAVAEIDSVTFAIPTVPGAPVTPPAEAEYQAVDLGLSVKWATFNVGATKPEEYGGYYAWGETEEKLNYSLETYKWCKRYSYSASNSRRNGSGRPFKSFYLGQPISFLSVPITAHIKKSPFFHIKKISLLFYFTIVK
jgi:hypothetical protein